MFNPDRVKTVADSSVTIIPFDIAAKPIPFEQFKEDWSREIVANRNLAESAVRVAWAISFHLNRRSREAWPGIPTLCNLTGYSRRQAIRALEQLEKQGHIRVNRTQGRTNHYEPILQRATHDTPPVPQLWHGGSAIAMAPEPLNEPLPYGRGFAPPKDKTNDSDNSEERGGRGSEGLTITSSDNPLIPSKPEDLEERSQRLRLRFEALSCELRSGLEVVPRGRRVG